jgi:hypothetical protein
MPKKKRPKVRSERPTMLYMVACDAASRDPASGKETLYGVFEKILMSQLPGVYARPISVLAKLRGGAGEHEISFDVLGPDGRRLPDSETTTSKVTFVKGESAAVNVQIMGLTLLKAGTYKFVVKCDGRLIGSPCEIEVIKQKPVQPK